jgi:hypothetical protein
MHWGRWSSSPSTLPLPLPTALPAASPSQPWVSTIPYKLQLSTLPLSNTRLLQNIGNFPILTGLGISITVGFLNPCGINTPHLHPRATEFLTLVEGSNLEFGFVLENGLVQAGENPEVAGYLNKFEGTVFPQGSIHYQFNNNCEKATFFAALSSEDPGTNSAAQALYALNADVVNATLGFPSWVLIYYYLLYTTNNLNSSIDGKNIKDFGKYLPANLVQDIEVCLKKCTSKS